MTISSCDIHLEILYGSQTGCAEDVAKRISREGWRRHFKTRVKAMDDFDPKDILNTTHVIFVCSTTGQGVEPDNMRKFWKFLLRKSLPQGILSSLEYAVFGLGDSSYEKFNFPAKKLYRRVEQLGGSPLISLGEGDDQHYLGLDGALDPWLKTLWQNLLQKYPLKEGYSVIPPQPSFDVKLSEYNASDNDRDSIEKQFYPGMRRMVVKENNRITSPDHFQDVRRLTFNTNDDSLSWNPGDCAFLYPQNMENNVEAFLSLMGWHPIADKELYITASPGVDYPARLPSRTTLRKLSTYFFDISGVPRRSFFEMASYFSTHEDEREKLREFASAEGQDDMHSYCTRPKRTLLEVLGDFTSIKDVPLNYIFDVFPPLRPRYFSISSHPYYRPGELDLTVGIVNYKTIMKIPRVGVCTAWMSRLKAADKVYLNISKGTMKCPSDSEQPIIMVGPGTGIAAFRSFVEYRASQNAKANLMFFGCRFHDKDFLYKTDLKKWQSEGYLELFSAFSRDQMEKRYVQHRIVENAEILWDLIQNKNAMIFVSGNANKMPDDVRRAFTQVLIKCGGFQEIEATEAIRMMRKSGYYQEECWY